MNLLDSSGRIEVSRSYLDYYCTNQVGTNNIEWKKAKLEMQSRYSTKFDEPILYVVSYDFICASPKLGLLTSMQACGMGREK